LLILLSKFGFQIIDESGNRSGGRPAPKSNLCVRDKPVSLNNLGAGRRETSGILNGRLIVDKSCAVVAEHRTLHRKFKIYQFFLSVQEFAF